MKLSLFNTLKTLATGVVLTFILATSCKKEKIKTDVYLNEKFKKYIDFKEGSYWIYQDSLSGTIDSSFINLYNDTPSSNKHYPDLIIHGPTIGQRLLNYPLIFWNLPEYVKQPRYNIAIIISKGNSSDYSFPVFGWEETPDFPKKQTIIPTLKFTYFDSLQVKDKWYKEVILSSYVNGSQGIGHDDSENIFQDNYYAPNIGLIKMKLRDGRVFELIRYTIK